MKDLIVKHNELSAEDKVFSHVIRGCANRIIRENGTLYELIPEAAPETPS